MNDRQIACFLEAVKERNFTKVAEKLYLTQPGVSRMIATLEKELNTKLFARSAHKTLELTESAFLEDEVGMYRRMESLRERGFLVSMDDFGTGYSTMNMLKNQTLDEIKIDREFIRDLEKDKSLIIIRNTIAMLQQLGVHIVIEGVETEEQKEFLLGCNCTDVQGFLFYRPMPVEEFDKLLWQQEREPDMAK